VAAEKPSTIKINITALSCILKLRLIQIDLLQPVSRHNIVPALPPYFRQGINFNEKNVG
jgi:hypothetical protein